MNAHAVRPSRSFDKEYARAQLALLGLEGACAHAASCWLNAAHDDVLPTLEAFKSMGGDALGASLIVFEFGRAARVVEVGENFLRAAGVLSPADLASVGATDARSERARRAKLIASGHAVRNVRQVRYAGGAQAAIDEIALPVAGAEGMMILCFADFGAGAGARFENPRRDFDIPAYSKSVDLFRRDEPARGRMKRSSSKTQKARR